MESSLHIRPLAEDDCEALFEILDSNRDDLGKWLPWVYDIQTLADALVFTQHAMRRYIAGEGIGAGVWFGDTLVGMVRHTTYDKAHLTAEMEAWLGASFRGYGLATHACRSLMRYSFNEGNLHRLEMRVPVGHERALMLAERLGFCKEGVLRRAHRHRDRYHDVIVYGMLSDEWEVFRGRG